jgi:hypothetical protein
VFSAEAAASTDPVPIETAKAIYSELGSQIRALTDVRFKLLTIVLTITGLALTVFMTQTIRDASRLLVLMAPCSDSASPSAYGSMICGTPSSTTI